MVRVIEKDVGAAMEMPMEKKNKKKRVILELAEIFWVEICGFYWDFFPEHTGVSARQRAGTLESVVQYDQETFAKVWDYPASNSSEDDPFFFSFFFSGIGAEYRHFFRPFAPRRVIRQRQKTKQRFN